jgi:PAS domain S-box-containing protein
VPSLILRLEQLARPDEPPAPAPHAEPAPQPVDVPSPGHADVSSPEPEVSRPDVETVEAAPVTPPPPAEVAPLEPPIEERPARVVDLGASERLSTATPLSRWSAAVAAAHDGCFVVDRNGVVISVSVAAVELLGCGDMAVIGRHVLDVVNLVDLETGAANPEYAQRITPLVVLDGPGLGRSLIRVRHRDGTLVTLDTASVPVHDVSGNLLGSVTFLAPIPSR